MKAMMKVAYVDRFKEMGDAPFGLDYIKTDKAMAWLEAENEALARENGGPKKFGGDGWTAKLAERAEYLEKEAAWYGAGTSQNRRAAQNVKKTLKGVTGGIKRGLSGAGRGARAVANAGKSILGSPGRAAKRMGSKGAMNDALGYESHFAPKEKLPEPGGLTGLYHKALKGKDKLKERRDAKELEGLRPNKSESAAQNALGLG